MQARNVAGPRLNAARTTFVGDNGQPLRGPFTSTEWTAAAPYDQIARVKELGLMQYTSTQNALTPNILLPEAKLRDTRLMKLTR